MDNQFYNYFLAQLRWKKESNNPTESMKSEPMNHPKQRFVVKPIVTLGKMMVSAGQSLQTIAQPSYHQPVTKSNI